MAKKPESNVVDLPVVTRLDLDPERALSKATGRLKSVLILGYTHEGGEYFASSIADGPESAWLLDRAKLKLLKIVDEM